jgi:hypothetical protein
MSGPINPKTIEIGFDAPEFFSANSSPRAAEENKISVKDFPTTTDEGSNHALDFQRLHDHCDQETLSRRTIWFCNVRKNRLQQVAKSSVSSQRYCRHH